MRQLLLIVAVLSFGGAVAQSSASAGVGPAAHGASPAPTNRLASEPCQRAGVTWAERGTSAQGSKLGELPPGNLVLAVLRGTKGCYRPVIVRKGYGAAEFNQSPRGKAPVLVKIRPRRD